MQKAYDILIAARSVEAINMFMDWILKLDNEHYKAISPRNLLVNLGQELKTEMRKRLFEALKEIKDASIKSRITDLMETLRQLR